MADDPYASFSTPATQAAQGDPYAAVASPVHPAAAQQPSFETKPFTLSNGVGTYMRPADNAVYLDPSKGDTSKPPGWYNWTGKDWQPAPSAPAQTVGGWLKGQAQGLGNAGLVMAEGMAKPGMAVSQLVNKGLGAAGVYSPETMAQLNQEEATRQQMMDQDKAKVWGGGAVDALGQGLATAPLMLLGGDAPAGATLLAKVAHGAGQAGLVGMGTRALTPEAEQGQGLADTLAAKAAGSSQAGAAGAAMGGAVPVVGAAAKWIGSKGANLLAGTKLGDVLGVDSTMVINPKFAGAQELKDQMDQAGVRTSAGDISGNPAIRAKEEGLARNNENMMDWRLAQNQEGTAYAQGIVDNLKKEVQDAGWTNLADVQAVQPGDKRYDAAQTLLTAIKNSGEDWGAIAQTSGNLKLFVNKLRADQLYDTAEQIGSQFGNVPTPTLQQTVGSSVKTLRGNVGAPESAKSYLGAIEDGVNPTIGPPRKVTLAEGEAGPRPANPADPYGTTTGAARPANPSDPYGVSTGNGGTTTLTVGGKYTAPIQDMSFGGLRRLRSSLQTRISDIMDGTVSASSEELPHLERTVKAIETDLNNFSQAHGPELAKAYQNASDFYKGQVVPYKEAAFGKALADTDPMKLTNVFNSKNTTQQQRMFDLLGDKGQAALRSGIIEDAFNAGEKTQRGVTGPTMSAANVASKLEKLDNNGTLGVAFKGEDRWGVQGMAKILRTIDRSDTVAFTPKTGMTAEMMGSKVEGGTTLLGAAAKGYDWLTKDNLFKLYTDPKLKSLLIHASDLTPGSPAMTTLINTQLPKVLGIAAGRAAAPDPAQQPPK